MLKKGMTVLTFDDEYKIEAQINQGGNGTIYRVKNSVGTEYALKAIDRNKTTGDKLKRFRNELHFCMNKRHPNLIRILDFGTYENGSDQIVFYVMPMFPMTLRNKMDAGLKHDDILPLFYQLLEALKFAHNNGTWHRDVKPENILIDKDGTLVLADFGIAHFSTEDLSTIIETRKADRLANFTYAAPEQRIKGGKVDHRADIFAAGLILNEMFTGSIIAGANYSTISSVSEEYAFLDGVVEQMVCQSPENRLSTIEDVALKISIAKSSEANQKELLALAQTVPKAEDGFQPLDTPEFNAEYKDGALHFHLINFDPRYLREWFNVLKNDRFSCGWIMGYEKERLRLEGSSIIMPLRNHESHQTIKSIVSYIKSWISSATQVFNSNMIQKEQAAKRAEERKIQDQIEHIKREESLRAELNALLKDI